MSRGISFRETMAGGYRLIGEATERPISFTITAESGAWQGFLRRPVAHIEGTIDAEGLATGQPLSGYLEIDLLRLPWRRRPRRIAYAFQFQSDDGRRLAFIGEKNVLLRDIAETITVLPGSILRQNEGQARGEGERIASATLRFDLRGDLGGFLRSFRIVS